jgi:quercetin dioxygenase-like cupin family protein
MVVAGTLVVVIHGVSHDCAARRVSPLSRRLIVAAVPGNTHRVFTVNDAPGGKSGKDYRSGSLFADVRSGAIRSENSATGTAKVYTTGQSLFETPGSEHFIRENAKATDPACVLRTAEGDGLKWQ